MNQYFNENQAVLNRERMLELEIFDSRFKFFTNNGLFSCEKVDAASIILLENIPSLSGTTLDLGCGYGPIGIVLAKIYPVQITMSDINPIAVDYATKNAILNNVKADIAISNGFESLPFIYENIVLNPPIHAGKDVMYKLYQDASKHLHPEGSLYIVIQKKHGAESTMKVLSEVFRETRVLYKKKGLYVLQNLKPISAALDINRKRQEEGDPHVTINCKSNNS